MRILQGWELKNETGFMEMLFRGMLKILAKHIYIWKMPSSYGRPCEMNHLVEMCEKSRNQIVMYKVTYQRNPSPPTPF